MQTTELDGFVSELLGAFHDRRLKSIAELKLRNILKRKNPYLYKAKNILTAEALVKSVVDAHLSSQEETIFGELLEQLAIYVCQKTLQGRKSSGAGIDLEFQKNDIHYIVAIKSGPNWGNSQQLERLKDNFKKAIKTLRTNNPTINVRAVNGCCYGKGKSTDKGDYLKLCGQDFWELISGDTQMYLDIIKPFEKIARKKEEPFQEAYVSVINRFTKELLNEFSSRDGSLDWEKILTFNSGGTTP